MGVETIIRDIDPIDPTEGLIGRDEVLYDGDDEMIITFGGVID